MRSGVAGPVPQRIQNLKRGSGFAGGPFSRAAGTAKPPPTFRTRCRAMIGTLSSASGLQALLVVLIFASHLQIFCVGFIDEIWFGCS